MTPPDFMHAGYVLLALSLWLLAQGKRAAGLAVQCFAQLGFFMMGILLELPAMVFWSAGFFLLSHVQLYAIGWPKR